MIAKLVVFASHLWPSVCACITWMSILSGNLVYVSSLDHWMVALRTGVLTGVMAVLLTFTPIGRLHSNRYGHAFLVGIVTVFGDAFSHDDNYARSHQDWASAFHVEAVLTGASSGILALARSYAFMYLGAPLRAAWSRMTKGARQ